MTDPLSLEADPFHTLRGVDRDHLLAAALLNRKRDEIPAAATVRDTVGRLSGENSPVKNTTASSLDRLESAGYIKRVEGEPIGTARGVRVTDEGYRVLARGAARLDAVASVRGEMDE